MLRGKISPKNGVVYESYVMSSLLPTYINGYQGFVRLQKMGERQGLQREGAKERRVGRGKEGKKGRETWGGQGR